MINIYLTWLTDNGKQSLGHVNTIGLDRGSNCFFMLGLPWNGNKPNISRIPNGVYKWIKWESPTYKTTVIRLKGVPGRSNILIHPANFVHQLRGCMSPGLKATDINGDGEIDVTNSRLAMKQMLDSLPDSGEIQINQA